MQKGLETREMILRKSAELFNVFGYEGCSMNDIMQATGLKKGGIYNHFPNKDELAVAAYTYSFQSVIARFRERLDRDRNAWEKIHSVIDVMANFYENPVIPGGCPIFNTAMDSIHSHPRLRERAQEGLQMLIDYLAIKIRDGVESGEFRPVKDPRELAAMIIASMEGGLVMSRAFDDATHVQTAARYLKHLLNEKLKIEL